MDQSQRPLAPRMRVFTGSATMRAHFTSAQDIAFTHEYQASAARGVTLPGAILAMVAEHQCQPVSAVDLADAGGGRQPP